MVTGYDSIVTRFCVIVREKRHVHGMKRVLFGFLFRFLGFHLRCLFTLIESC